MIYDLQKASMWKRISAFLFDFVVFLTVLVGCAYVVSAVIDYGGEMDKLEALYTEYEEKYNIVLSGENEEYDKMSESEKAEYDARFDEAEKAFDKDERAAEASAKLVNLSLLIISIGFFVAFLITEFVIPLLLGNGQTLGKKIFGICLMRDDGVKVSPVMLFVRAILGKYTVETMVPVFIVLMIFIGSAGLGGLIALLAIFVFNIILIVRTRTNSPIHDLLAYTVVVDKESQMIFESKEAMLEYKQRIHNELAEKQDY